MISVQIYLVSQISSLVPLSFSSTSSIQWVWPHPGHGPSLYLATFTLKSVSHPVPPPALLLLYLLGLGILSVSDVSLPHEHPYILLMP